jgi:hypothetical protein
MTIFTPLSEKFQEQAVREIELNRPKAIVMVDSSSSWLMDKEHLPLTFIQYVNRLQESYQFLGGIVSRNGESRWVPASEQVGGYKIRIFVRMG